MRIAVYISTVVLYGRMHAHRLHAIDAEIGLLESELKSTGFFLSAASNKENGLMNGQKEAGAGGGSLIISSGDISDVDGLFALAKYAQSGADVVFVMNYPAYLQREYGSLNELELGCGYDYGAGDFFSQFAKDVSGALVSSSSHAAFNKIKDYKGMNTESADAFHNAFTDLAFHMVTSVWNESNGTGKLFFCVGGINDVNPFACDKIKNEFIVYSDTVIQMTALVSERSGKTRLYSEGDLFNITGQKLPPFGIDMFDSYESILIDFNGSMAFLSAEWCNCLISAAHSKKLKAAFVMGGVHAYESPCTMPRIVGVLNRLSCATMNQVYSPFKSFEFFCLMRDLRIPTFVVSNNIVHSVDTFVKNEHTGADTTEKNDIGYTSFMEYNGLKGTALQNLAKSYYTSRANPARKPFDFYIAVAVCEWIKLGGFPLHRYLTRPLFFDREYGVTLISTPAAGWLETRVRYEGNLDMRIKTTDDARTRTKKESFRQEVKTLRFIASISNIPVRLLQFYGGKVGSYELQLFIS